MKKLRLLAIAASLPFALLAYACGDDDANPGTTPSPDASSSDTGTSDSGTPQEDATPATPSAVELKFEARVGAEAFGCGKTFTGIGTTSAAAAAGDFRFFVHDVKLLKGTTEVPVTLDVAAPWQNERIALLDFENATGECEFGTAGTNDVVKGIALGTGFDGIAFTVGVPEDLNHKAKETQAAPLPNSGLNWDWTNGYIHFAVQLNSNATEDGGAGRVPPFYSHVGSTMCTGDPDAGTTISCAHKNRPQVRLTGFDPTKNKIVVDAKKILETSNIDVNAGGIPGCMSGPTDPECPAVFAKLGLDFSTGNVTGSSSAFTVETK